MEVINVIDFVIEIVRGFARNVGWLLSPNDFLGIGLPSPLFVISFGFLIAIIPIAITKWLIN